MTRETELVVLVGKETDGGKKKGLVLDWWRDKDRSGDWLKLRVAEIAAIAAEQEEAPAGVATTQTSLSLSVSLSLGKTVYILVYVSGGAVVVAESS